MAKKVVKETIHAKGFDISIYTMDFENEFISLTDIAKYKSNAPNDVIKNWMRSRETLEFLGLWETLHNPDFKPVEFDGFRKEAGLHAFTMSPSKWIESVNAIGITTKAGRYGGTYAHSDIVCLNSSGAVSLYGTRRRKSFDLQYKSAAPHTAYFFP